LALAAASESDDRLLGLPRMLTTDDVAEICSVRPTTVSGWARDGVLRGRKLGGGPWRFSREDVLALTERL
jgi:excisionase family DNA binding protein